MGHTLNLGGGDGIDVSLDFSGGVSLAGGDHLSANLLCIIGVSGVKNRGKTRTSSAMAVVPSRPSRREALSWDFARSTSAMVGLIDIRVHSLSVKWVRSSTFMRLARQSAGKAGNGTGDRLFRNKVDTPETGVRVGSGEGHVRVGKVVAGDDVGQPAAQEGARAQRPVPVTKDALHDEHGPVVGRLPSDTLDGDGEVDGVHRVVADADFGADKLGGGVGLAAEGDGVGGHGEGGKVLFGELDEGVVLDGAGADEGHPVGGVVFGNVGLEVRLGNRVDVFLGAEDGVSERGAWQGSAKQRGVGGRRHTLEGDRVQVVKDDLFILLLDLFLLPQNHVALPLNRRLFELGVLENVGQDVDRLGDVLVERLGVVDGLLARGVGVEVGAEVLDLELELGLGARPGALEGEVLSPGEHGTRDCPAHSPRESGLCHWRWAHPRGSRRRSRGRRWRWMRRGWSLWRR